MAEVILTNDNFKKEVLEEKGLVLVDFYADWCGPCKMVAPVLHQIAQEQEGKVKVCKLNVDDVMGVAQEYKVVSIPTIILFRDGEVVNQMVGYHSKEEIMSMWS